MRYCNDEGAGNCPKGLEICCWDCADKCAKSCRLNHEKCGCCEQRDIETFEDKAALAIRTVSEISLKKKELDEVEKEMKQSILEAMEKFGIKKFENESIRITYTEPTTRVGIDGKKLKAMYPDVAKECEKVSDVRASVRITVK